MTHFGSERYRSAHEVDFGVAHVVEEHQCGDGHGALFGDFAGIVETELHDGEAVEVDEFAEVDGSALTAEAGQTVDALVAIAAVAFGGRVVQHIDTIGELGIES
jgi:hypothetical protein